MQTPPVEKTFFKTRIVIDVLSEKPIEFDSITELGRGIHNGDWIGDYTVQPHKHLNTKQAARLARKLNSDPEFLGITPEEAT